jgi:hypothetical protein
MAGEFWQRHSKSFEHSQQAIGPCGVTNYLATIQLSDVKVVATVAGGRFVRKAADIHHRPADQLPIE